MFPPNPREITQRSAEANFYGMEALEDWLEELNYLRIVHERRQVDGLPAGAVNWDYYVIGCNRQTNLTGTRQTSTKFGQI